MTKKKKATTNIRFGVSDSFHLANKALNKSEKCIPLSNCKLTDLTSDQLHYCLNLVRFDRPMICLRVKYTRKIAFKLLRHDHHYCSNPSLVLRILFTSFAYQTTAQSSLIANTPTSSHLFHHSRMSHFAIRGACILKVNLKNKKRNFEHYKS